MNILHVYKTYFPESQGGLEEVIRQICLSTISLGAQNRILTITKSKYPSILERTEGTVYGFPRTFSISSCEFSLTAIRGFKNLADWSDLIHYHFPWPFADLLHSMGNVKKNSLVTYHSDIIRQKVLMRLYSPLMQHFLANTSLIVATSPNYFATSSILGRYSEKVEVIPIGIDDSSHPPVSTDMVDAVRAQVGEGFFLFIGVLRYYKGLHILLDAIRNTSLRVVIVGSGPVESELRARAAREGIRNIHFLGYVEDTVKVALLQLSKAVVFPSHLRSEAFGVTLVEGAMYGKPLISTEIGTGTSYVNEDRVTGFVVPPSDPKRLREAMEELRNNPELAKRMGRKARQRYELFFTGREMGKRYVEIYKTLMGN